MGDGRKLRIGIIGCGVGFLHLEGLESNPRVDVLAIAGLDEDRCRNLAEKYRIPRVYRDYQDLIADPDIEAVTIAVPNALHYPVALAAIEAGKHVMVEKPLSRTSAEGEEIVAAAARANRVLGVVFNRRGRQDVQIVKREVERGHLGDIYHARAYWMRRSGIPGLGTWFTTKEMAGGGPLIDLGVHVLDMAMWVLGNPTPRRVSAATYAALGPQGRGQWRGGRFRSDPSAVYDVEDFATAFIRFDGGLTLHLNASWAAYTGHGDDFGLAIMGTQGGAQINAKDYAETGTLRLFGEIEGVPTVTEPQLIKQHGHGEVLGWFINSVLDGAPMSPSGEEGLARVRLIEAIYRSAELGKEIEIDSDENTASDPGISVA